MSSTFTSQNHERGSLGSRKLSPWQKLVWHEENGESLDLQKRSFPVSSNHAFPQNRNLHPHQSQEWVPRKGYGSIEHQDSYYKPWVVQGNVKTGKGRKGMR